MCRPVVSQEPRISDSVLMHERDQSDHFLLQGHTGGICLSEWCTINHFHSFSLGPGIMILRFHISSQQGVCAPSVTPAKVPVGRKLFPSPAISSPQTPQRNTLAWRGFCWNPSFISASGFGRICMAVPSEIHIKQQLLEQRRQAVHCNYPPESSQPPGYGGLCSLGNV